MLILYIVSLIVGGVLVLLGAFGVAKDGGGDADTGEFGHEIDKDFSLAKDAAVSKDFIVAKGGEGISNIAEAADKELWIPFFSLRFWTYLAAGFGLVGTLATILGENPLTTLIAAIVVGLVAGLGISYASFRIRQSETSSNVSEQELLGKAAKVLVRIDGVNPGRVRLVAMDDIIDMLAVSEDGKEIPVGESVVVVGVDRGRLQVLSADILFGDQPVIEEKA